METKNKIASAVQECRRLSMISHGKQDLAEQALEDLKQCHTEEERDRAFKRVWKAMNQAETALKSFEEAVERLQRIQGDC